MPATYLRLTIGSGILCPPFETRSAIRCKAKSGELSQKKRSLTVYPFVCALRTRLMYDLVARVVSIENVSPFASRSSMRCNISLPASMATLSGLKGDRPLAISSAFTNSLQSKTSGSTVYDAVVLPAPLQPLMIYRLLFIPLAKLRIVFHKTSKHPLKM